MIKDFTSLALKTWSQTIMFRVYHDLPTTISQNINCDTSTVDIKIDVKIERPCDISCEISNTHAPIYNTAPITCH